MNDIELKSLWQSSNEKIEHNLQINKNNMQEITRLKIQNALASMKPIKMFTLIVGILWVLGLGVILINLFIYAYDKVSLFFLYSATVQVILTAITIAVYVYQIDLMGKIDFDEPILSLQEKLSKLKVSTLNISRLLFLQLPLWTTFYWNKSMFENGNISLWLLQIVITLLFTIISIWLFFNINSKNKNKKWFQWIFSGKEWKPIIQAIELSKEISDYKKKE